MEAIKQEAKQDEPLDSGTHTALPLEPVSTFYHNPPTEPVILSPYVQVIDTKQKEIDELREMVATLMDRVRP